MHCRAVPLALLLALAVAAAACSSAGGEQVGTGGGGTTPTTPSLASTTTASVAPATDRDAELTLDAGDALLTEADVPAPWELTGERDVGGYDIGPDQADCEPYWALERLAADPVRSRLWFQPGANLDHEVFDAGEAAAPQFLAAVEEVPERCPLITWNEGGSQTAEPLELAVDGVVAVAYTTDVGEVSWFAYASRANLVSRLRYVHFGDEVPGESAGAELEHFRELARTMLDRLAGAVPHTPPPPPPTPSAAPPETATTAPPSTDPPRATGLESALVTADELPGSFTERRTDTYESTNADGEWIPGCDASRLIQRMDGWFELERTFAPDDGPGGVQHLVGRAPSATEARVSVASLSAIADCDVSADVTLAGAELEAGIVNDGSGGLGTWLLVTSADEPESGLLLAYHVQEVIGVLAVTSEEGEPPSIDGFHELLKTAAARAVAL